MPNKSRDAQDKQVTWNPDEVIKRPKGAAEQPLSEEQKRQRAMRFVWGPGDLRRVLPPPEKE